MTNRDKQKRIRQRIHHAVAEAYKALDIYECLNRAMQRQRVINKILDDIGRHDLDETYS